MKNYLITGFCIFTVLYNSGCKEPVSNVENNKKMEDTLFKSFPTVRQLNIEVTDDEDVIVTLGAKELYNAPEEKRQEMTDKIGHITMHIYDKDNWLKKGSVVFIANESNLDVKNEEKKTYDMKIEQLKKDVGK